MDNIQLYALGLISDKIVVVSEDNIDYQKVLQFLKKNKISLLQLKNTITEDCFKQFLCSEDFVSAYNEESDHYQNWHDDFMVIKDAWAKENIDYIFHKSTGSFPYMSDNLDVLVKTQDFKRAGEILTELGYANLRNIQEAHKEFYRKFMGDRVVCPIHLHERVCWNVPYEDINHLWVNAKTSSDGITRYPGYNDALLINTAHCFIEDHQIKIYDLLTIKDCIDSAEIDWDYVINTSELLHWRQSLHAAFIMFDHLFKILFHSNLIPENILKSSWDYVSEKKWIINKLNNKILTENINFPFQIPHLWTRVHSSARVMNDPSFGSKVKRFNVVASSLIDGFIHNKLKIKSHPSLFVVVSGIDGSGKSSHIKVLNENLVVCGIKPKIIWSRAGSLPIIQQLLKILHRINRTRSKNNKYAKQKTKKELPKNQFTSSVWRILNSCEMVLWYNLKIRIPLLLGQAIIADRYIYDSIVDMEILSKTQDYNRIIYKVLEFLVPTPDTTFYLDVDLNEIVSRGVDEKISELDIKKRYYSELMKLKQIKAVDNNGNFDVINSILSLMSLTNIFKKYPDKYNGYQVVSYKY